MLTTFHRRVRDRARDDMRALAREELDQLVAGGCVEAGGVDSERLVDDILADMLPGLPPFLGETLAALMLQVRVIERIDERFRTLLAPNEWVARDPQVGAEPMHA